MRTRSPSRLTSRTSDPDSEGGIVPLMNVSTDGPMDHPKNAETRDAMVPKTIVYECLGEHERVIKPTVFSRGAVGYMDPLVFVIGALSTAHENYCYHRRVSKTYATQHSVQISLLSNRRAEGGAPSGAQAGARAALAMLVLPVVAGRRATRSAPQLRRNHRFNAAIPAPLPDPVGIVGAISGHRLGSLAGPTARLRHRDRVHQVGKHTRLVALPGRYDHRQRQTLTVAREMHLRGEAVLSVAVLSVAESRAQAGILSAGSVPFLSSFGPPAAARAA